MTRRRFLSAKRELILLGDHTEENRVISGCLQSQTTGFNLLRKMSYRKPIGDNGYKEP